METMQKVLTINGSYTLTLTIIISNFAEFVKKGGSAIRNEQLTIINYEWRISLFE